MASAVAVAVKEAAAPAARAAANTVVNGQNIFVYTNIQTQQTIYSLTRSLWNKKALKQMPYAGKKSIPSALRKDIWHPLCVLSFPTHLQGLDAYAKMREFKMLHETAWDQETMTVQEGPHAGKKLVHFKERRALIMDQKANAIADMAATLFLQEEEPEKEDIQKANRLHMKPIVKLHNGKQGPAPGRPKYGKGKRPTLGKIQWQGSVKGVKIHWSNMLDAEYAETWPQDVLHGTLQVNRYTAVWPPQEEETTGTMEAVQNMLQREGISAEGESQGQNKWWQFGKK